MLSLVEKLEDLKAGLNNDMYIDMILQSLPPSYDPFIVNYNMNGLEKSIHELINMLVQYEATTHKSERTVLVGEASTSKVKGKGARRWKRKKGKGTAVTATASTGGAPPAAPKGKGKGKERGIGRGSVHNSSPTQVLERSRRLSKDEMILRLGDGKAVVAEAVGSLRLIVSNHIRIDLKDCYFVPSMVKNIISIPLLDSEGFKYSINKSCFYLVFDDVYHLLGTLVNGLYILQQSNLIMTAQHKRKVDNHEKAQIWHARLGHISNDKISRTWVKPPILGIKIYRDRSRRMLGLTQSSYIEKVLKRFKMEHSKRGLLPMRHGIKLSKKQSSKTDEELKRMSNIPYASFVGSIQYVVQCTRPDVAYALSVMSRYQACAGKAHWGAVKSILKYLKRTKDMFLIYGGGELILEGYSDASFQSNDDDAKSQSDFVFKLNGGVVAWKSSKQDTTADSTTEAEYIAASEAAKEAVWMKNYIQELGVVPSIAEPVVILCNNNGAIAQAKEPRPHHRSKHILRRYQLLREMVSRDDCRMDRVSSAENTADPLAKLMSQVAHT
ncbi:UNVERIFIED_CONTAM: Retrovirus-related Pol polyprotein from transposon TNT 1-94 [Sesamum latifolium]|uniref:Retrovirus-related Pol polyprotein from transposon TNT 1-94 n=1 Tax=Sesamum latifolium TaxID=2727402 RepID=A0AAW2XRX8_9LAMI